MLEGGQSVHQISLVQEYPLSVQKDRYQDPIPRNGGMYNLQFFAHWNKSTLQRQALPEDSLGGIKTLKECRCLLEKRFWDPQHHYNPQQPLCTLQMSVMVAVRLLLFHLGPI